MMFHSFRHRLIITFSLFVVFLLLIIACSTHAWFSYHTSKMLFREQFNNVSYLAHSLDDKILTAQQSLLAVAKVMPLEKRNNPVAMQQWLADRAGIQTIFRHGLFVYDDNSKIIAAIPEHPELIGKFHSHHPYLQETISNNTPYISRPFRSKVDGTPVMAMTAPVFDKNGKLALVLAGQIKLQSTNGLFHDILRPTISHTGYFYLFGNDRTVYLHPDSYRMFKKDVPLGANKAFDAAINGFEGTMETTNSKGIPFIVSTKRLKSVDLILAANFPLKEAYAPYYRFISIYLLGIALTIMLGVVAAWLLGRRLSRSISNLSREIYELSKEPDPKKRISGSDEMELQLLSESFNNLLDKLCIRESKISDFSLALEKKNQELAILLDKAQAATKAKDIFLATMSHEIRTPLNGIIGMTGLLMETGLDVEQKRFTGMVRKSSDNLLEIINDILDFSKIEAGHLELERIVFEPRQVLEDVLELLSIKAAEKELELTCYLEPTVPCVLKGDPCRLRQVLTNLVNNAIKFTEQGEVSIRATLFVATDEHIVLHISVQDTGIGIPENRLKTIFEPFTQADGSTTRKYGGSGLGLAICKQLVQAMGGEINLESTVGKGSTFWFTASFDTVPDADMHQCLATPTKHDKRDENKDNAVDTLLNQQKKSSQARILLVEDNEVNQTVALAMLTKAGYKADVAFNGAAAIELLQKKIYDLVLMDCQMPIMDGFEATRRLRVSEETAANRSVPVIAMTANAMNGDRERCLSAGMDDYLPKPVKPAELKQMLVKYLQKHLPAAETGCVIDCSEQAISQDLHIFNQAELLDRVSDSVKLMYEIIEIAIEDIPQQLNLLRDAIAEDNRDNILKEAHTIKGCAANIGATELYLIAKTVEKTANTASKEQLVTLLQELEICCEKLLSALNRAYDEKAM